VWNIRGVCKLDDIYVCIFMLTSSPHNKRGTVAHYGILTHWTTLLDCRRGRICLFAARFNPPFVHTHHLIWGFLHGAIQLKRQSGTSLSSRAPIVKRHPYILTSLSAVGFLARPCSRDACITRPTASVPHNIGVTCCSHYRGVHTWSISFDVWYLIRFSCSRFHIANTCLKFSYLCLKKFILTTLSIDNLL
jgi:hypothetical protein